MKRFDVPKWILAVYYIYFAFFGSLMFCCFYGAFFSNKTLDLEWIALAMCFLCFVIFGTWSFSILKEYEVRNDELKIFKRNGILIDSINYRDVDYFRFESKTGMFVLKLISGKKIRIQGQVVGIECVHSIWKRLLENNIKRESRNPFGLADKIASLLFIALFTAIGIAAYVSSEAKKVDPKSLVEIRGTINKIEIDSMGKNPRTALYLNEYHREFHARNLFYFIDYKNFSKKIGTHDSLWIKVRKNEFAEDSVSNEILYLADYDWIYFTETDSEKYYQDDNRKNKLLAFLCLPIALFFVVLIYFYSLREHKKEEEELKVFETSLTESETSEE